MVKVLQKCFFNCVNNGNIDFNETHGEFAYMHNSYLD